MDNLSKILGGLLIASLIYIILISGCGSTGGGEVVSIDTVKNEVYIDTIWLPTEDTVYTYIDVKIPKSYFDTTTIYDTVKQYMIENFDDFVDRSQIYQDTITNDTVSIHYKATVWGVLEDLDIGYKVDQQYTIVKTKTLHTEVTKIRRPISFYMGLDAGANASGPTYFAPIAELVTPKMSYNAGFDIINKSIVVGVRAHISFRKKPKNIPRP